MCPSPLPKICPWRGYAVSGRPAKIDIASARPVLSFLVDVLSFSSHSACILALTLDESERRRILSLERCVSATLRACARSREPP